jgi:hypothetical protein
MNAAWSQFPLRNTDQSAKRMMMMVQLPACVSANNGTQKLDAYKRDHHAAYGCKKLL